MYINWSRRQFCWYIIGVKIHGLLVSSSEYMYNCICVNDFVLYNIAIITFIYLFYFIYLCIYIFEIIYISFYHWS